MIRTRTSRISREQYRALPEGPLYYELIGGELVEMRRPARIHYLLFRALFRLWDAHLVSGPGGELATEPNLYLPQSEDVYHPDLPWVRADNLGICRDEGIFGAPDIICEILSPSTERKDRHKKLEAFRQAGVPNVWLMDPVSPVIVEEYVLAESGRYELHASPESPALWEPRAFPGWWRRWRSWMRR